MSVIYCISVLALIISIILFKKSEKKLDIIKNITMIMVLFVCYQTFISYAFTIAHIPITLLSLTLINVILSAILIGNMLYKKEIQKYYLEKTDLLFIVVLSIVVLGVSYLDFGFPYSIKYIMTDASVHYISAREFYENESLLSNVKNINTSNAMMPGAYSNIGILFKVFEPWIGQMNLYKVFIGFDVAMLFLAGLLFYETIKKYAKNNLGKFLAGIVSIIYLLGYPLNNLLFGYFYLGIGVLVINAILAFMQNGFLEETKVYLKILTLFLLCFELFFSYYLFAPATYGALFIFYVIYFKKKIKKLINKEMIVYTIITLVIPTILGFCYHVLPGMLSSDEIQVANVIQVEGYIYRNLYSNILLFVPFLIYYLLTESKKKKINFDVIALVVLIAYMCTLYIGIFKLNISTYYFFKTYFVLWQIVSYLFFRGICNLMENKSYGKYITSGYIAIYILVMIYSLCFHNVPINKSTDTHEKITDVMDIYGINKTVLLAVERDYTKEELEILDYIKENITLRENSALILGNQRQEFWFWAMLQYRFKENLESPTTKEHIQRWNNGDYEYLVYFNRGRNYKKYKNQLNTMQSELIYQNETGAIWKYKK